MKYTTLRFSNIESLASFTSSIEVGYYAIIPKLLVKGIFNQQTINFALNNLSAEFVESGEHTILVTEHA